MGVPQLLLASAVAIGIRVFYGVLLREDLTMHDTTPTNLPGGTVEIKKSRQIDRELEKNVTPRLK